MSKEALAKVVQRAISDAAFRRQLNSDPAGALRGFDLSADEASAIRAGDAGRLSTLGVDQRMSKSFALGGALASTRMASSDLTPGGGPALVDDLSGAGGRTAIPGDPILTSADAGGTTSGTSTVRAGDDYKFANRVASDTGSSVRTGDDWKFADRTTQGSVAPVEGSPEATAAENASGATSARIGDDWKFTDRAAQGSVAPVEGSPEATAAENASGGGMANYPAHDGLAGPSGAVSARAGDDWARSSAGVADSGRIGSSRLDDATGGASGGAAAINDDPDGFLAANANADTSGSAVRPTAIHDDPDGFLAANADAGGAVTRANVIHDDPDGFLAANADAGGAVTRASAIHDDPDGFLAANADATGGSTAAADAFIDESESYLTKVGYDSSAAASADSNATYSGDDIAGPSSIADTGSDDTPHAATDEGQITSH